MRRIPFYAPTRSGPLAAVADLPVSGPLVEPVVAMLPSIRGERIRIDAYRDAACRLAETGQPVLRFDYPGHGADPGEEPDRLSVIDTMRDAVRWFREAVELRQYALGGGCAGGLQTLILGADDPDCLSIVVEGSRLRTPIGDASSTFAAGMALFNWVPRPQRVRADAGVKEYDEQRWDERMLRAIEGTADSTRIVFVYGRDSGEHRDFQQLQADEVLATDTARRVIAHPVGQGGSLNTTRELDHVSALRDALESNLRTRAARQ